MAGPRAAWLAGWRPIDAQVATAPPVGLNTVPDPAQARPKVFELANQWFVRASGKIYGPLDGAKLKTLATAEKITRATEVAQTKDGPWHLAANVKGLFPNDAIVPPQSLPAAPVDQRKAETQSSTLLTEAAARLHPKRWYRRWWAKWIVLPFLAVMAFGLVIQLVVPQETLDRWEAEGKERQRQREANRAAQPKTATDSKPKESTPGVAMGYMTGALSARDGARKPSSDELDAVARRAATQNNIAESQRGAWIYNFKTAFWMGWRKGQ